MSARKPRSPKTPVRKVNVPANMAEDLSMFDAKMSVAADLVRGVGTGILPGVVISGPPGVGKSHTLDAVLRNEFPEKSVTVYKGKITPLALYNSLLGCASPDSIVVFDDCDSAFEDVNALNILKAALDPATGRTVSWNSMNGRVEVPRFKFEGGIVILTNAKVSTSPHYAAFTDRIQTYDVELTAPERIAKLYDIAGGNEILDAKTTREVMAFIEEHLEIIGERISLRVFVRIAELTEVSPKGWKMMAKLTIFRDLQKKSA